MEAFFMDVTIGLLDEGEIGEAAEVVNSVFDEFIGPEYSEEGRNTFREYASGEAIAERMRGKSGLFIAAREKGGVIGALEVRDGDHIALFFVKSDGHRKGIGRQLFSYYLEIIEKSYPSVRRISVKSGDARR
ncbi:MAG: GNAT family N-acetyltransferase [Spirochaetaceae bacterium]|jgi:GNAT superfamily N-acetyltransferase|nr:GNAT family N-acetyltransferase [Spirochaetaceae bacterium]